MSQQGGRGSKKTLRIPYLEYLFTWELFQGGGGVKSLFHFFLSKYDFGLNGLKCLKV